MMFFSAVCRPTLSFRKNFATRTGLVRNSRSLASASWDTITEDIVSAGKKLASLEGKSAKLDELDKLLRSLATFKANVEKAKSTVGTTVAPSSTKDTTVAVLKKENTKSVQDRSVITPRASDYSAWYNDVISGSDMVDQSPVRGCMVIKPWGMGAWDLLRSELDIRIRKAGVSNAYFPLFIPLEFLAKEAEHVDGFAKECAVVTHHRLSLNAEGVLRPDPSAELEEPLIVRPTSETMIWKMFGRWINSHRDLPMKINQWANVVRWEMRTRPFLRTTEFLWQEGHTAHATADDALELSLQMLDVYADLCKDMLALPVIKGEKSPSERFAGADNTYTIEALMQNGWALQSGTSHFLGQNFAKAFDVFFQNEMNERELVWATSWGVSTRLLGGMVMTHSDDQGLVLPPKVAPIQVVVVPITTGNAEKDGGVVEKVKELKQALENAGVRVHVDDRDNMRPGAKYFEWERKGLPIRLEIGPKDLAKGQVLMALRHTGEKIPLALADDLSSNVKSYLDKVQEDLFAKATARLEQHVHRVDSYEVMKRMLESDSSEEKGFYLVPWACNADNERAIKEDCKATIRCYPFAHNKQAPVEGTKCFFSGQQATHMALFARAF
eukprot:gene7632-8434_t